MRWAGLISGVVLAVGLWLVQFDLRAAPLSVSGPLPEPLALGAIGADPPVLSVMDWRDRRAPLLRSQFARAFYGDEPLATPPRVVRRTLIARAAFGGLGKVERFDLAVGSVHGDVVFSMLLASPEATAGPVPVVIAPNFCGNAAATGYRFAGVVDPSWLPDRCRSLGGRALARVLHGGAIVQPPFAQMLADGYAVATYFPGEIVPDDPVLAEAALARLPGGGRRGAIGAWAWSMSRVVDVLFTQSQLDPARIAVFGHSRFGKAALWAAATDQRIALVIANQSGRLGAAPSGSRSGESLPQLFERFPHWFPAAPGAQTGAAIDQHLLLALIAPRPILLGGARLDGWSDPAGAFRAAEAATPVYRLYGGVGLDQADMSGTNYDADIAVFLRPGGHGIRLGDWTAARAFLDAHFKRGRSEIMR